MKKLLLSVVLISCVGILVGCKSIHVGGSGEIGGVHGGGAVTIPVPQK